MLSKPFSFNRFAKTFARPKYVLCLNRFAFHGISLFLVTPSTHHTNVNTGYPWKLHRCVHAGDARLYNSTDYHNLRREAIRSVNSDRKRCIHEIAERTETAAGVGHFGKILRFRRSSSGKAQPTPSKLCEGSGRPKLRGEQKFQSFTQQFSHLPNGSIEQRRAI